MYNGVAWVAIQGGGGSDPSSYSLATTVLIENLNGGSLYQFRLKAHNIHGWGLESPALVETVSGVPDKPSAVTV